MSLTFAAVQAEDFEALLALRVAAMRPSLEALGRYEPERARQRFAAQFEPSSMQWIEEGGHRVGLLTVLRQQRPWYVQHLYLEPKVQGRGIGQWAIDTVKAQAQASKAAVELDALQGSRANRFYQRQGFRVINEGELDITYRWEAAP